MFWQAVDEVQAHRPLLLLRGCFGHSWDLWPVSLARYVSDMRQGERDLLAAEALLALASRGQPLPDKQIAADRLQAEWFWTMLADHAWNGTDDANKRINAELRRVWSEQLQRLAGSLLEHGWKALGLQPDTQSVVVFNSLSLPRRDLVRVPLPDPIRSFTLAERRNPHADRRRRWTALCMLCWARNSWLRTAQHAVQHDE